MIFFAIKEKRIALFIVYLFYMVFLLPSCSILKEQNIITLKYAAWNLGTLEKHGLERQMIDSFMKLHPYIKIVIEEDFLKKPYDKEMANAAKNESLPDVFMYSEIPLVNENNWCADISDIVAKDSEWREMPKPFIDATGVKGKVISIPYGMYLYGYFYNADMFSLENVEPPEYAFSIYDFRNILKQMTSLEKGHIGLADESTIIDWFSAAVNPQMGWFSWDGGKLNLDKNEFAMGVSFSGRIYKEKLVYSALSEEEKKKLKGENDWEAWQKGSIAMKFDGTWSLQEYSNLPFIVGFAGIPGGRACVVPDFAFISSKCKYPKEAYEFAKFMSPYSREGFKKRLELAKIAHIQVGTFPILKDKELQAEYFKDISIKGIKEAYYAINDTSFLEGYKILPGYAQARWSYETGIKAGGKDNATIGEVLTEAVRGELKIQNVANELNSVSNECIQVFPRQYIN